MRHYTLKFSDDTIFELDAEMDTLKEGCVILTKKKKFEGPIERTDVKPEVVMVVSLANLKFYAYVEND